MDLKIIGIGTILAVIMSWVVFLTGSGTGTLFLYTLVGIYIGWIRKDNGLKESLINYVFVSAIGAILIGFMSMIQVGRWDFRYCTTMFIILLMLLLPGVIIGWILSYLTKSKSKHPA